MLSRPNTARCAKQATPTRNPCVPDPPTPQRRWRLAFAVGVLFLLVLLGCTLGIMWAVMLAHKDTQVGHRTMRGRGQLKRA